MLTLYDYLPSQTAYKVRLLLHHLGIEYRTVVISMFERKEARNRFPHQESDWSHIGAGT